MKNMEECTSPEDIARTARRRTLRRVERIDILVASLLLLLLLFGWAKDFAREAGRWPGSGLLTAGHGHHAWSGGALR